MRVSTTLLLAAFAATSTAMVLPGPTGTPAAVPAASPVQIPTQVTPTSIPLISRPKSGEDPENSLGKVCGAGHKECGMSGCCHNSSACVVQKGKGFCVRHDFLRLAKKGLLRKRQSEFDYDAYFGSSSSSYYDPYAIDSDYIMSDYLDSMSSILDEYTSNMNSISNFDYDSYYTSLLASLTANNPALESLFMTDAQYQSEYYASISSALEESLAAAESTGAPSTPTSTDSGSSSSSSSSSPSSGNTKDEGSSGMSKTAIIGIVVAVVVLVIAALIGWCVWRRRHPKTPEAKLEVLQTGPGHVPIPGPQVPISNGPDAGALPNKDGSFYAPSAPQKPPLSPPPPMYPTHTTELDGGSSLAANTASNVPSRHTTPAPPPHGVFETEARPWSVPPPAPSTTGTTISGSTLTHNPSTVSNMTHASHGQVHSPGQAMYGNVHEAGGQEIPAHQQPPRPMQAPYVPQGPIFEMGDQR